MRLHQLLEGRHDPHRLKAIFMLGSPGSGKSAVANRLIGGTGLRLVNSDTVYEWLTVGSENPIVTTGFDDDLYRHSGRLMARRLDVWRREGLGLLIDVTGRNVTRLLKLKHDLEKQGYDTMAIFVNADLVTALNRNDARRRRVNPDWHRARSVKRWALPPSIASSPTPSTPVTASLPTPPRSLTTACISPARPSVLPLDLLPIFCYNETGGNIWLRNGKF